MTGNRESRCFNSSISGAFQRHLVGHLKTHSIADSLQKKAKDKEARKRRTQEKANAMINKLAALRVNPQAAPNSEAAEEAESIARFEFGASISSLNSAS